MQFYFRLEIIWNLKLIFKLFYVFYINNKRVKIISNVLKKSTILDWKRSGVKDSSHQLGKCQTMHFEHLLKKISIPALSTWQLQKKIILVFINLSSGFMIQSFLFARPLSGCVLCFPIVCMSQTVPNWKNSISEPQRPPFQINENFKHQYTKNYCQLRAVIFRLNVGKTIEKDPWKKITKAPWAGGVSDYQN